MQRTEVMKHTGVRLHEVPLLARFVAKIVLDILPAALASVIGGFLFTQYQFGHSAAPRPAAEQDAPASAEMMQIVRDEHAMIVDYLKAQAAAQKGRHAAEDEADARAATDAKVAAAAASRRMAAAVITSKPVAVRSKAPLVATIVMPPHAPLVIARAEPNDGAAPVASPAREPDSLLAKTLDLKDHVVDATLHAVSAIGSIPSWIASMGDRSGGAGTTSGSAGRMFNAS